VDGRGGGNFATIQAAVDARDRRDTIFVHPGVYIEEVVVPTSVSILGSGWGRRSSSPPSRPGSGNGSQLDSTAWVFKVRADNVTIGSLTIDGDNPNLPAPVDARGGIVTDYTLGPINQLTCRGVEVKNVAYRGIYAFRSAALLHGQHVSNVNLQPPRIGRHHADQCPGEVARNTVVDCALGIGMQGPGSGGSIAENVVSQSQIGILTRAAPSPPRSAETS
jgi:hypothetical protein